MFFTGCPVFALEKPILTPYLPDSLRDKQKSGKWFGELKLKSKRSIISTDHTGRTSVYLYNTKKPMEIKGDALARLQNLPPKSLFDCCVLEYNSLTRLWIFDCLMFKGKLLDIEMNQRKQLLSNIATDDLIWIPLHSDFWLRELDLIKNWNSGLVKETALKCGIPYCDFREIVTGMVIKNKHSFLSYPEKTKFVASSMFKINLI